MDQADNRLFEAVANARETEVMDLVRERINAGQAACEVLAECNRGMVELGNRFAVGECYLPDLMFAGMIMKGVTAELSPLLEKGQTATGRGTVVMGSVQHDVHDIGKDIVITMLRGSGFGLWTWVSTFRRKNSWKRSPNTNRRSWG
jgi:5-methyltetrahydrofolate--homocysteine methyltransferase